MMSSTATVKALWISPGKGQPMRAAQQIRAVQDYGLEGCAHGSPDSARQVLLVESELLAGLGIEPGKLKENITTAGLALNDLRPGALLKIGGEAVLEITRRCHPCRKLESIRRGVADELLGRRGLLAIVCNGGWLQAGDPICIVSKPELQVAAHAA